MIPTILVDRREDHSASLPEDLLGHMHLISSTLINSMEPSTVDSCWMRHVPWLRTAEAGFRVRIAMTGLDCSVYPPAELITPRRLHIIRSGVVLHRGKLVATDRVFGNEALLSSTCTYPSAAMPYRPPPHPFPPTHPAP